MQTSGSRTRFEFGRHETFPVRHGWLAKGLGRVRETGRFDGDLETADALGLGSRMAKSLAFWLEASGLAGIDSNVTNGTAKRRRKGQNWTITDLGNIVTRYDPHLEYPVTWWFVHMALAQRPSTVWGWFLQRIPRASFLPRGVRQRIPRARGGTGLEQTERSSRAKRHRLRAAGVRPALGANRDRSGRCVGVPPARAWACRAPQRRTPLREGPPSGRCAGGSVHRMRLKTRLGVRLRQRALHRSAALSQRARESARPARRSTGGHGRGRHERVR